MKPASLKRALEVNAHIDRKKSILQLLESFNEPEKIDDEQRTSVKSTRVTGVSISDSSSYYFEIKTQPFKDLAMHFVEALIVLHKAELVLLEMELESL